MLLLVATLNSTGTSSMGGEDDHVNDDRFIVFNFYDHTNQSL